MCLQLGVGQVNKSFDCKAFKVSTSHNGDRQALIIVITIVEGHASIQCLGGISTMLGNLDVGISKYAPNGSVLSFHPSETLESRAESLIWVKYSIRVYMTIFYKI